MCIRDRYRVGLPVCTQTVTHPSSNRARCIATWRVYITRSAARHALTVGSSAVGKVADPAVSLTREKPCLQSVVALDHDVFTSASQPSSRRRRHVRTSQR